MGKDIQPGIYEQVINKNFTEKLAQIAANFKDIEPLDQAEAAGTLTAYLRHIIDQGLLIAADQADKNEKLSAQITLTNQIIQLIRQYTREDSFAEEIALPELSEADAQSPEGFDLPAIELPESVPLEEAVSDISSELSSAVDIAAEMDAIDLAAFEGEIFAEAL